MRFAALLTSAVLAAAALPGFAHATQEAARPAEEGKLQPPPKPAGKRDPQAYFTDRELLTQNGEKVRFYSDVLKGRMVVINTIFTNCKDACPLITEQMNKVRAELGASFGKEIQFVSISSDPLRDTPAAMKKFAAKHKADVPGWVWLTGSKDNVDHVLKKLGQWSENIESHSTVLIAWNFNTDRGRKMMANIPAESIATQLKLLASSDPLPLPAGTAVPGKTN